jgi:hypothetical protein
MYLVIILVADYYDLQTSSILHLSWETTEEHFKGQCREIYLIFFALNHISSTEDTLKDSCHEIKFCPVHEYLDSPSKYEIKRSEHWTACFLNRSILDIQTNRGFYLRPRTIHSCQKNIDSRETVPYYKDIFAIELINARPTSISLWAWPKRTKEPCSTLYREVHHDF